MKKIKNRVIKYTTGKITIIYIYDKIVIKIDNTNVVEKFVIM